MDFNIKSSTYNNFLPQAQNSVKKKDDAQNVQEKPLASVLVSEVEQPKSGIKKYVAGISIGGGILLTLIAGAFLSKGVSGGVNRRIREFSRKLSKKTFDLKADYKNLTLKQKISLKLAQAMKPIANLLEASSNLNVFKDGFVTKCFKELHAMPLFDKINGSFKNVVLKTKNNAYKNSEMSMVKFCNYAENLAKDSRAKGQNLDMLADNVANSYFANFSTQHHFKRSQEMWESLADLHERVWNSFNIFKKENNIFSKTNRSRLKTYMTMKECEKERNSVGDFIKSRKKLISNNITDNYNELTKAYDDLKTIIDPKDNRSVELMRDISQKIEKYKRLNGAKELEERAQLGKELGENLAELKKHLISKKVDINKQIAHFENVLNPKTAGKGQVQEILTRIKETFGKESPEYKQAKKYADELNKNLNHAISTEMTAYEKLAELQMGSAPTDIIGILAPAALGTALVIKADTKDQRITNTLTQGIPILGGIGTAYYGTTRMLTGPTNMALGLISGALLGIVGAKVDDLRKSYQEKQNAFKKEFETMKNAQKNLKETILSTEKTSETKSVKAK